MSDILSNYYKTFYAKTNMIKTMKHLLTPDKRLNLKTDITAEHLSPYGIYLSENNTLLLSKKQSMPPLSLMLSKKLFRDKCIPFSEKHLLKMKEEKRNNNIENNKDNNNLIKMSISEMKKCFPYKKKNKILINNIENLRYKKIHKNNKKEAIKAIIINNDINIQNINNSNNLNRQSRNILTEFSTINTYGNNYSSSIKDNFRKRASINTISRNEDNKSLFGTIKKAKNKKMIVKNVKKDIKHDVQTENKMKAEKILKELLSLKTNKDIKNYYIKKDYAEAIAEASKHDIKSNVNKSIDPLTIIKFNLENEPKNNNLFKSFNTQVMIMGNQKHRNDFLDGINIYKNKIVRYEDLRGPTGFDKNKIEEKKRNKILQKMKINYIGNKGFAFSNKLYKHKFSKKLSDFEFDNNYQSVKKLLFYNIEKYENNIKNNSKKIKNKNDNDIDKNDLKILNRIDSEAEFVIHDREEMLKFSHKFLSFDNKMNKIISKTRNATDYLSMRAKENQRIKNKIVQLYNDDVE